MKRRTATGFTLIELMITLVILGILVGIVAPGFQKMIRDNRIKSEAFSMRAALSTARSEAMKRRRPVVMCPSVDGSSCNDDGDGYNWASGFIAFVDEGDEANPPNDTYDAATEELVVVKQGEAPPNVAVLFNSVGGGNIIRFSSQGYVDSVSGDTSGTLRICDDRKAEDARGLIISPIGVVRAATDTDAEADSIVNDHAGDNLAACPPDEEEG